MKYFLFFITTLLSSCSAVEGHAGTWTGIVIVIAVVGLILFLVNRNKRV